jgi:hypothetical protein
MVEEEVKGHYRGILCLFCRQPIPLSAKMASLEAVEQDTQPDAAEERLSRVITVRCRACQKEAPYRVSEFADFEGTPRPTGSSRPVVVPWRQRSMAKASGT